MGFLSLRPSRMYGTLLLCTVFLMSGCLHSGKGSPVRGDEDGSRGGENDLFLEAKELLLLNPAEELLISSRILPWYGGKRAACSLTFDDGTLDQYLVAFPLMKEKGYRGTFYILTGLRDEGVWQDGKTPRRLFSWKAAGELAAAGNEIGSHGVSHRDLRALFRSGRKEEAVWELEQSAGDIISRLEESLLPAGGVLTFSWPFWRSTPELEGIASEFYLGARTGGGSMDRYFSANGGFPVGYSQNLFNINSYGVRSRDRSEDISAFLWSVYSSGSWALLNFHGVDDGREGGGEGWDAIKAGQFEEILSLIRRDGFWIAPVGEILRYREERRRAVLRVERGSSAGVLLSCEDGLNDGIYNMPVTVDIRIGTGSPVREVLREVSPAEESKVPFMQLQDGWYRMNLIPDGRLYALVTRPDKLAAK